MEVETVFDSVSFFKKINTIDWKCQAVIHLSFVTNTAGMFQRPDIGVYRQLKQIKIIKRNHFVSESFVWAESGDLSGHNEEKVQASP